MSTLPPVRVNTFVIRIIRITDSLVTYVSENDAEGREYHHVIPHNPSINYNALHEQHVYTLINARIESDPRPTWRWWKITPLDHTATQVDERVDAQVHAAYLSTSAIQR